MRVVVAMILAVAAMVPDALLAGCLSNGGVFWERNTCESAPQQDKVFNASRFMWQGSVLPYMAAIFGNEVELYRTRADGSAGRVTRSSFNVGNVGDSDYDLLNVSVCDGCRFGVASYKRGTVLFDLGTASKPAFLGHATYNDANLVPGAFTFRRGVQQYAVMSTMTEECDGAGVFRLNSTTEFPLVHCLGPIDMRMPQPVGGLDLVSHIYLIDKTQRVYLYEVGAGGALTYVSTPMTAYGIKGYAIDWDAEHALLGQASASGLTVWDVSDPGSPAIQWQVAGDWNRLSFGWPFVFVSKKAFKGTEAVFDVRSAPRDVDTAFWDPAHSWNWPESECAETQGATLVGTDLYLWRYTKAQRVDVAGCLLPPECVFSDSFETGDASMWTEVH
jgi:hypothetical protein